jgi:serine phosphatase RsbU (regulator of sigma subunit)
VYRPFSEVGGDFFQVIPFSRGTMIAIGDVSGKGMPAALMVSLLIGTLHTLAETMDSPAEILAGLNRRALGHSHGGFTTCLVVLIDADGGLTVANAGHLAPYLNGAELRLENDLPLGLDANATYAESTLRLEDGDRLVLMTDGVVEARNVTGELFGFERTAELCGEKAEIIARTAEEFGQEDDITVLSLTRARE